MFDRLWEEFLLGLRNLWRYKLRSFLTTLGIIFGISSVIAMMAVGAGARTEILDRIGRLGVNNIILNAVRPPENNKAAEGGDVAWLGRYGLTFRDFRQIQATCPELESVLPVHIAKKNVWHGSKRLGVKVFGVLPEHLRTFHLVPKRGRAFTELDNQLFQRVCVIREGMIRELGIMEDPLGMDLKIGEESFRVIGILPSEDFDSPTSKALALDSRSSEIYVPFETILRTFGTITVKIQAGSRESTQIELDQIIVKVKDTDAVFQTAKNLQAILGNLHKERDYEIVVPLELLAQSEQTQKIFNIVLLLIAGISLLVGGIGIVNIMLATISERTREIGIRRALGAKRRSIAVQFLMETLAIATTGGLAGCLLGIAGVFLIEKGTGWRTIIAPESVVISIGISCAVGILFGLYPAWRAAKMDPIVALRHE